jgi:Fur family peroxide stress response transcriptional regulator
MVRTKKPPDRPLGEVKRWCLRFENVCRERGLRVTSQRLAVYRALAGDTSHPTADAIYAKLHPKMSWLSLATVYRILESLEREGFVRRVSTTNGVGRFDANLTPHQHLVCRSCGRMTDFEQESLSRLCLPQQTPGFMVEELEIRIIGTCEACHRPGAGTAQENSINNR